MDTCALPPTVPPEILYGRDAPPPRDHMLRLEALKLALAAGGSDDIVRKKAEAYLAFLKGDPAPAEESS